MRYIANIIIVWAVELMYMTCTYSEFPTCLNASEDKETDDKEGGVGLPLEIILGTST